MLEVGCGSGAFARHLPPGVRYRGLEFNQTACATARTAGLDVEARSLQDEVAVRPAAYDVVCHFQALAQAFTQAGVSPTHTWHEPVADYHQAWQFAVAVRAGFQHLRGREPELVTSSGAQKFMNLMKRVPGLNDWLYARALAAYPEMTRGSTVCMFGSKNA